MATQRALTLTSAKVMVGEILTVTVQDALLLEPSAVVAVMVDVPLATAVTTPPLLTVATSVLLLVHVTFLLVALEGVTVAVRVDV